MGSKGGGSSQRALSQEEKDLFAQQTKSLKIADEVAGTQLKLSKSDREYFDQIFRGEVDPNSPEVKEAVKKALLEDTSGADNETLRNAVIASFEKGESVDKLLFDYVKSSKSELSLALSDYADKTFAINEKFGSEVSGLSSQYVSDFNQISQSFGTKLDQVASEYKADSASATSKYANYTEQAINRLSDTTGKYQTAFEQVSGQASSKLGTADTDILGQQRGQQLAGISQAYKEAQNELLGTLSRRGLAGSGVEAQSLSTLAGQQAQQQAGALSQSYNQAVGLSDQRRLQQVALQQQVGQQGIGIAGQLSAQQQQYGTTALQGGLQVAQGGVGVGSAAAQGGYQAGTAAAQNQYQTGLVGAQSMQQLAAGAAGAQYGATTAGIQQNIANYQLASGVGQGVFGGSANYLAGAGTTANQTAQIAGSTGVSIGNTNQAYLQSQQAADSAAMSGIGSLVGTIGGAYATGGLSTLLKKP